MYAIALFLLGYLFKGFIGPDAVDYVKMPLGMDPESPETVQNSYPLIATYTFGVEVKF